MLPLLHFVALQQHLSFLKYTCLNVANTLSAIVENGDYNFTSAALSIPHTVHVLERK